MPEKNSDLWREKMEGNFQNVAQNNIENDAEEITDSWNMEDINLIKAELLKMNEAKQKSYQHVLDLQQKVKEEQKAIAERQAAKLKLQKEIVELQGQLNDERYQHGVIKKDLNNMREMSKSIEKYCVQSETMLEQTAKDKSAYLVNIEKLKRKSVQNISKFEEACSKKRNEEKLMKETVESQRKIHHDNLQSCEEETLKLKEKLLNSRPQLERLKQQADALLQARASCRSSIAETEADNIALEEVLSRKQEHSGNLLQQMEEERQAFEQRKEELANSLNEARFTLQKKETEIEGVQRGIKNQTEYNNNIREKLADKVKEVAALRLQTEQLEAAQSDKLSQVLSKEESVTVLYNSKLEEVKNAETLLSKERESLNKTEEQIKEAKQVNQELVCNIDKQETIVAELKKKQICQLDAISACEQELPAVQLKLANLKEELIKWQQKNVEFESKMLKSIAYKIALKNSVVAETLKTENETQEAVRAVILEMESIQRNSDIQTAQETSEFEKKKNERQLQIEMIEKGRSNTRTLQMQLDDEFEQNRKKCDDIIRQIQEQEALKQTHTIVPQPPIVTSPPADDYNFRATSSSTVAASSRADCTSGRPSTTTYASTSNFFLPPPGPVKPRAFDEFSGSSAEGNVVTYQQMREIKREKQRRQQAREQKKMQLKKSAGK